ncbi:sodium-dependent transporter [Ferrimonas pelagia]|uniref:Transporter n=1 Tax=Ferrimonas pelagia TaxID=1177826 RepID=A0ABP9FI16_9GAMM
MSDATLSFDAKVGRAGTEQWSSRMVYVLAMTGSAVGLGNIWRFPYIMGEHGGGAFVLVYLLCIGLIGLPVLMSEALVGKFGRRSPAKSVAAIAQASGSNRGWSVVGTTGSIAGFLILSFYVVIAGWAVAYTWFGFSGQFTGKDAEQIGELFGGLLASPSSLMVVSLVMIAGITFVVSRGIRAGLEAAVSKMMPLLFVLLSVLVVYAAVTGEFGQAVQFMFAPDFSKLTWTSVLVALGHSFFTLSLASGIVIMYGAYLPEGTSIARTSVQIALLDTVVALLAGLAIFPIVFANGLEPGAGPGLLFHSLPIAFGSMPMGQIVGGLFFLMVVVAAFTSGISLIESTVVRFCEITGLSRINSAMIVATTLGLMSLLTVYSFAGADWASPEWLGMSYFDAIDQLTEKVMLPLGGLAIAVFTGWFVSREISLKLLNGNALIHALWLFCVQFLAPAAIVVVFLQSVGVLRF